jgi:hypothetical protein
MKLLIIKQKIMKINSENLEKMKQKALLYYKENKKIISPLF